KRFQVVDPLTVADVFASGGAQVQEILALPERAIRISKRFDVAGWVVPVLIERRGVVYLDATWISAVTGTALFSRREPLLPPADVWVEEDKIPVTFTTLVRGQGAIIAAPEIVAKYGAPPGGGKISPRQRMPTQTVTAPETPTPRAATAAPRPTNGTAPVGPKK